MHLSKNYPLRLKVAKRKFEEDGWVKIPNPPLKARFVREPVYFTNIPLSKSPRDIFLSLLGHEAQEHILGMFNSQKCVGPYPASPISERDLLRYLGMHMFLQLRPDLDIHQLCQKGIKEKGFLGKHRFDFIHQHRNYDPIALYMVY
jgi:hypothetical protein